MGFLRFFERSPVPALVAEALDPRTQGGAQVQAIKALSALPPDPRALDCFVRLATERGIPMVQQAALDALRKTPPPAGTRGLLTVLSSDMGSSALSALAKEPHAGALPGLAVEACAGLSAVLSRLAGEARFGWERCLEVEAVATRVGTPAAVELAARARAEARRHGDVRVPRWLRAALTATEEREVREAVEQLTLLATPAAAAALAEFRAAPPRPVKREVLGGIGTDGSWRTIEVTTRELGQQGAPPPP